MTDEERADLARTIIGENQYMVLATADDRGRPWASPVWYGVDDDRVFFWVSSPEATHSRNIEARPEIGIVIFDSRAPLGAGQAVYMHATATMLAGSKLADGLSVFSSRSVAGGGPEWARSDVEAPASLRLYRAVAIDHSILAKDGGPDRRVVIQL